MVGLALARLSTPKQPEAVGVLLRVDLKKTRKALQSELGIGFQLSSPSQRSNSPCKPPLGSTIYTESSSALVFNMAVGHGPI